MSIDWWTLGLQAINALALIWILSRYLFGPVSALISERRSAATAEMDRAAEAVIAAEQAKRSAEAERSAFANQRAGLLAGAQAEAEAYKTSLIEQAEAETAHLRAETTAVLQDMRRDARQEIGQEATSLAVQIARKLVTRLPSELVIAPFVTGLSQSLADLPATTRDRIAAGGAIAIKAPRPLTPEEDAALCASLAEALGRDVTVEIKVDPTLIAGLELDADTATVRNHLSADLEQIKQELLNHG